MSRTKKKTSQRRVPSIFSPIKVIVLSLVIVTAVIVVTAEKKLSSLVVGGLGESFSTTIYGRSSTSPELPVLAVISGSEKIQRDPIEWEDIPQNLVDAVIAIEDHTFFSHHGIRFTSMVRAALANIKKHGVAQGGSTITQQLAKNFFLSPKKTVRRKLAEAGFALYLETRLSKEKILTLYLNHIYWGQRGSIAVCGTRAAAKHYFNKEPKELTLAEAATLAGLIRSPHRYNPFTDLDSCLERRNTVLRRMKSLNLITAEQYDHAVNEELKVYRRTGAEQRMSGNEYYVSEVIRQLYPTYGDGLFQEGYKIYTNCDPAMQSRAEHVLKKGRHQAALVALEPTSGRVLALVGGRDYAVSQFNRVTQARRQPGSIFKPFVVAAALEENMSAATLVLDQKKKFVLNKKEWKPANFENVYHGTVTIRKALAESMNLAILDLALRTGLTDIIRMARVCGLRSFLGTTPSMALGSYETSLLDITNAYAPFANQGSYVEPILIEQMQDSDGNVLEIHLPDPKPAIRPQLSYLMTSLLESVFTDGTAKAAAQLGWKHPSAGKTGTTNDGKDAWFIGYTSNLLVGVWVGDDQAKALNLTGAKNALPLWVRFMQDTYKEIPPPPFVEPSGLVHKNIDPASGQLARSGCLNQMNEVFIEGSEPTVSCELHPGGVKGWLKRLFRKKEPAE